MKFTTQDNFEDATIIETIGIVTGNTVRARHIGSDFLAGLRNVVGGEARGYSSLLSGARDQALERLGEAAKEQGANAVVCLRISTASITHGMAEILAYGTAVRIKETKK